ncbi:hypothetical protein HS125_02500 [bacterium]|nr:hypothetical protein [bacterium]
MIQTSRIVLFVLGASLVLVWVAPAAPTAGATKPATPEKRVYALADFFQWLSGLRGSDNVLSIEKPLGGGSRATVTRKDGKLVEYDYRKGDSVMQIRGMEYGFDQTTNEGWCKGSVHITSGTAFLRADAVKYYFSLDEVRFDGSVTIGNSEYVVSGDRGVYDVAAGTVEITSKSLQGCRWDWKDANTGKTTTSGYANPVRARLQDGELANLEFVNIRGAGSLPDARERLVPGGAETRPATGARPPRRVLTE